VQPSRVLGAIRNNLTAIMSLLTAIVTAIVLTAGPAAAATAATATTAADRTPALLYDYELIGATGIVKNSAPTGPVAPLTLSGTWAPVPNGVYFRGNTRGAASVGYGRPASGYTLNVSSSEAVGFGTRIVYYAPAGRSCFGDTPNITQIGRYAARTKSAQAKMQLSSCADSETEVMMECRFAGALTAPFAPPVVSTLPLTNRDAYSVSCVKSPDHPDGTATITLTVTDLGPAGGGQSVTNTFTVPALGYLRTRNYLSVGNKFPLPAPAENTDQFNGAMTNVVYCAGAMAAVSRCLAAHLPLR
jgi:hypothetical protein